METVMQIDITQYIGAVNRSTGTRDYEGKPARVVTISRLYDTSPEDLWDAVTSAERLPRWFMPVSGVLRLGGRYQLEGNAGGTIQVCEPPRQLKVTWEFGGQTSWVEVRIAKQGAGALLTLDHIAHESEERWTQFGPGAVGVGWDLGLVGLTLHLESKGAFDPKAGMEWMTSENGKATVRASSEAWGQASIAGGTPRDAALAAASRTTAFYTGA